MGLAPGGGTLESLTREADLEIGADGGATGGTGTSCDRVRAEGVRAGLAKSYELELAGALLGIVEGGPERALYEVEVTSRV